MRRQFILQYVGNFMQNQNLLNRKVKCDCFKKPTAAYTAQLMLHIHVQNKTKNIFKKIIIVSLMTTVLLLMFVNFL